MVASTLFASVEMMPVPITVVPITVVVPVGSAAGGGLWSGRYPGRPQSIQSGRGTQPDDAAATDLTARCQRWAMEV